MACKYYLETKITSRTKQETNWETTVKGYAILGFRGERLSTGSVHYIVQAASVEVMLTGATQFPVQSGLC